MEPIIISIVIFLLLAKTGARLALANLNCRHVRKHADAVPPAFQQIVDEATYKKSVAYTLAGERLDEVRAIWSLLILLVALFSGVLPSSHEWFVTSAGASAWSMAAWFFAVGLAISLTGLPFDWYDQFRLEQRFGFNTTTQRTWWSDQLKGFLLALVLGYPLLALLLKFTEWSGRAWWLWGWGALMAFQVLMFFLAPLIIMPLFNKFTPLPAGSLRERLLALAARTRFAAGNIQVMDGSRRSRHSNAFFTGFGRSRRIVLFDTLIAQLAEPELEAVLAHEIGHYKKRHILKTLIFSALGSLAGFYALSVLARQDWFYNSFGFQPDGIAPAFLLFALLSGIVTFWFSPLAHWWSRRNEYEADAFAAEVMREPAPLITALRKLNEKNLSNLTPHPIYSGFYYSHPTLLERERALAALA
ncbi:MAG TPA: M48 family metallopeptidase [Verrucomicrobiae bacterium]|nr:M48 family metallopeptidase [Verrucomicrobiae bacterium]